MDRLLFGWNLTWWHAFKDSEKEKKESLKKRKKERVEEGEMVVLVCRMRAFLLHSLFEIYSNASCNLGVIEAGWLPLSEVTFSWQLREMTSWADTHLWPRCVWPMVCSHHLLSNLYHLQRTKNKQTWNSRFWIFLVEFKLLNLASYSLLHFSCIHLSIQIFSSCTKNALTSIQWPYFKGRPQVSLCKAYNLTWMCYFKDISSLCN